MQNIEDTSRAYDSKNSNKKYFKNEKRFYHIIQWKPRYVIILGSGICDHINRTITYSL